MEAGKIILATDPEAATYRTDIKGWVSRDGFYYGENEKSARFSGATHHLCNTCGKPIQKNYYCRECSVKRDIAEYHGMIREEWNGKGCVFSQAYDRYFWDLEEIEDFCSDHECSIDSLRLIICDPTYAREIDPQEYYCDDLPEDGDGDVPDEIQAAFDELNKRIRESKAILSWSPRKVAAVITTTPAPEDH